MRFVKTPDEVRRLQSTYARLQFLGTRVLTVVFETTPEPIGSAWVGEVQNSNCVGPFLGAALYVRAQCGDIVGNYCLTMPMSTAEAVTFGRELYGEPKKLAAIVFEREGEHVWGSVARHDIRYLSLRGRLSDPGETGRRQTSSFHFKYLPSPDGSGFDHPPVVHVIAEANIQVAQRGRGEIVFRDSPHDPLADTPVAQVLEAVYSEGQTATRGEVLCQVDPEAFLPYAFGKTDALETFAESTLMHAQAGRRTRVGRGQWRETT